MRRYLLPFFLLIVVLLPRQVEAQQVRQGTITVIQPKPFLRAHRVELTPRFGATVNDAVLQQYAVGGGLGFGINEQMTVQANFDWFDFGGAIGGPTDSYEQVIQATQTIPELVPLSWAASLVFDYNLLYGKFVMFNRNIVFYDFYAGGGPALVESTTPMHVGFAANFGAHIYLSKWLSFNVEYLDRMSIEEFESGSSLRHTATVSAGVGVYLPFGFDYPEHAVVEQPQHRPTPEQTAPEQTAPEQTAPEQTAPEQTAPEQTAPEQTAPEQTAPETETQGE